MSSRLRTLALLTCLLGSLLGSACTPDPGSSVRTPLRFEARVGELPFACGSTYAGVGEPAADLVPDDLRFFVHDVRAVRADGSEVSLPIASTGDWQGDGIALLDFETGCTMSGDAATNDEVVVVGEWPADAVAARFRLGVPFARNHGDIIEAAPPLDRTALFWGWNQGYMFLRLRGVGVEVLLGSTGCMGSSGDISGCTHENVAEIEIEGFDPTTDAIALDVLALLADSPVGSVTCHGDPESTSCAPIMDRLGLGEGSAAVAFRAVSIAER